MVYGRVRVLECVWTIVIRTEHGVHYPGGPGLLCFGLMLVVFSKASDPEPVMWFMALWLVALCFCRFRAWFLFAQGQPVVSRYSGYPILVTILLPGLGEGQAKSVEALTCMGVSYLLTDVWPSLAPLLLVGAVAMTVTRLFEAYAAVEQTIGMRDAAIRMKTAAMRYRGGWEDF